MVDAVQQSAGWLWTNNPMLRHITYPHGYIYCHKQTRKGPGLHSLSLQLIGELEKGREIELNGLDNSCKELKYPGKNKTTTVKFNMWLFPFNNPFCTVFLQMKIGGNS